MAEDNTVYIGKKPVMNYVLAVMAQFNTTTGDVLIKARGRAISTAVDVAEIVRNRYMKDAKVKDIKIYTEKLTSDDGREANVSSIEIVLGE